DGRRHVGRAGRCCSGCTFKHDRAATIRACALEDPLARGEVVDERRAEAAVERGGERELVALVDLELAGQRAGAARGAGVRAQELVGRGELGADAGGLAAGGLDRALGLGARTARAVGRRIRLGQRGAARLDVAGQLRHAPLGLGARALQRRQLALELGLLVAAQALELGLELLEALAPRLVGLVSRRLGGQRRELRAAALQALAQPARRIAPALQPRLAPVPRRTRGED